jgi:phosphoglycerate dehydrogenase-like enzyme
MKCAILQPIDRAGLDLLQAAGVEPLCAPDTGIDTIAPLLQQADAVITRNWGFPASALAMAPKLQVVGVHGTGTDRIYKAGLAERGIVLVTTAGSNAQSVAEHCIGLMLASARGVHLGHEAMQSGDFAFRGRFRGRELSGRQLGLWGWGHISQAVAPIAQAIGMEVQVYSRHANAKLLATRGLRRVEDIAEFLGTSDVLSLHGVPEERPIIGAEEIALMRRGSILINTARGALVDERALADAVRTGHLFGAAIDVFGNEPLEAGSPLIGCPGLLLTPHVGGSTEEALRRTAREAARAVLAVLGRVAP